MQIVLIPGLMNDGWVWRHQVGPLSRVAPVRIACNDGCDSLAAMAARILREPGDRLWVAGHSMGGRVALETFAQAPGRIAGLALLDTGAHGPAGEAEAAGRLRLVDIARTQGLRAVARDWLPPMLGTAARRDAALIEGITTMLERCPAEIFARQQQALLSRENRMPLLPAIACPTLVATGNEDAWASPAQHAEMASGIPGATLAVIEGAGHMLPVEAPEALTRLLLDWLARGRDAEG